MSGPQNNLEGQQPAQVTDDAATKERELVDQVALAFLLDASKATQQKGQEVQGQEVQGQEVQQVTDQTQTGAGSDRRSVDPAVEITKAEVAAELLQIVESGKGDNEKIVMLDDQGRQVELTIGQRREQLRAFLKENGTEVGATREELQSFIKTTGERAIAAADAIRQQPEDPPRGNSVSELVTANQKKRDEIAQSLGFPAKTVKIPDAEGKLVDHTVYDISPEDFHRRASQTRLDSPEGQKLKEYGDLMQEYQALRELETAPSFTRLRFAELKMIGATDPEAKAQPKEGEIKPSNREIMDAYQLVNEAGRLSTVVSDTPQYQDTKMRSSLLYADIQQQRSRDAVLALQKADELRQQGKPEAEVRAQYEEALKKVEEVKMTQIRAQIIEQNKELQRLQQAKEQLDQLEPSQREQARRQIEEQERQQQAIITQLGQIIHVGKEVKTEYAKYLNERGKGSEALPLLTSAAAEAPEFCTPEVDPSFGKEMEKALAGSAMISGDTEKHRLAYQSAMNDKNWAKASRELQALKTAANKASEESLTGMRNNLTALDARKKEVDQKIAALQEETDATERAIKEEQLNREKAMLEQMEKNLKDGIPKVEAAAKQQEHQLQYMEGIVAWSRDDKETAHRIFKELKATAPEIAGNKDYQLDDLIEDTRKKGFFERHWDTIKKVATIGGAVLAGIAVGIAVGCVTGPGGILAGIGTTGAILTAAGVGAVAGGLTYAGLNKAGVEIAKANEWKSTAAYYENPNFVDDFKTGAIIGATSATGQVLFAPGGIAASSTFATTRLGTAALSTGRFATSWGGAPTVGYGGAALHQGYEVVANGKSVNDAIVDAGIEGTGYTAALLSAGKLGLNSWRGAAGAGFSLSGQDQARQVLDGKDPLAAAQDLLMQGGMYTVGGRMIGSAGANVGSYTPLTTAEAGFARAYGSHAWQTTKFLGNEFVAFGAETAKGRVIAGTLTVGIPVGIEGLQDYSYYQSRTPKDLSDPEHNAQISQRIELYKKPIRRPVVER